MKQQIVRVMVFCAACLVLGAQAQSSGGSSGYSGSSSSTNPGSSGSSSGSSGAYGQSSGWVGRHLSATGRMGHEDIKASELKGVEVKSSSGEVLGTITDQVISPASGRIVCAIVSLNSSSSSSGGATSPSGSSSGTSSSPSGSSTSPSGSSSGTSSSSSLSSSSSSSSSGKQVAVPWMLLRPSSTAGLSSSSSSPGQQPTFTFIGDPSKLQSAPEFSENTDVSNMSWRQSVYSHFGLTRPGAATGGAETPGGTGSSSGSGTGSSSQTPGSSGSQ